MSFFNLSMLHNEKDCIRSIQLIESIKELLAEIIPQCHMNHVVTDSINNNINYN